MLKRIMVVTLVLSLTTQTFAAEPVKPAPAEQRFCQGFVGVDDALFFAMLGSWALYFGLNWLEKRVQREKIEELKAKQCS